jgi:hypothetical protein
VLAAEYHPGSVPLGIPGSQCSTHTELSHLWGKGASAYLPF